MKHNHNKIEKGTLTEDSLTKDEATLLFGKYRLLYQSIAVPEGGLEAIIGHIKSNKSPMYRSVSWWKIGFVLAPTALLLFIVFSVQQGQSSLSLPHLSGNKSPALANIDEIEKIVYNMDASDMFTEEDDAIISIVQSDPTLAFNINYYDEDF